MTETQKLLGTTIYVGLIVGGFVLAGYLISNALEGFAD